MKEYMKRLREKQKQRREQEAAQKLAEALEKIAEENPDALIWLFKKERIKGDK